MHELWQAFQTASFGSCNEMSGLVSNRPAGKEAQTPRSAVGRCRRGFSLCESVTPVAGDIVRQELGNAIAATFAQHERIGRLQRRGVGRS
jgi:hypothetical protein